MSDNVLSAAGKAGDLLEKLGWRGVPITSFRLHNLVADMHYDSCLLKEICEELPYTIEEKLEKTVEEKLEKTVGLMRRMEQISGVTEHAHA